MQHCLMLYRWIGAVHWRPVHVFKTLGGMLPVLSLSFTQCLINHWLVPGKTHHFFRSFPLVSSFLVQFLQFFCIFSRFPWVSRRFQILTLEFPSCPGGFPVTGTLTPQWRSVAGRLPGRRSTRPRARPRNCPSLRSYGVRKHHTSPLKKL